MTNYDVLKIARQDYLPEQIPFLTYLRHKLISEQPYKGLKIFHNIPLTLQAVIKVEPLLLGGADVVMSTISSIKPHKLAMDILKEAGVRIQLDHAIYEDFDIYLDCCAELINAKAPQYGVVELTQTGTAVYKNTPPNYPVISVDDCLLKHLETMSTGEGLVSALEEHVSKDIQDKKFVLFGYGKVGRGIVKALSKYTRNIIIVEKDINNISMSDKNIKLLPITELNDIKSHLKDAFCVVTATGIKNLLSKYFDKADFGNAYLANMGAFDEFGEKFENSDVLFDKQAFNFSIKDPTPMHFLDLIFYAHNIAMDFLLADRMSKGYHAFDKELSYVLLNEWAKYHNEDFNAILKI